jgi:heterodisulfide reductase subunit A
VASLLKLARSADGFFQEAHPKFRPVDTLVPGVFLAGMAQGPKDIPDTVSQASGAAARAIALMNRGTYYFDPQFAFVEADRCTGCELCLSSCPYDAISMKNGKAEINSALCTGCGVCIGHCPDRAIDMHLYSTEQLRAEIRRATEKRSEGEVRILIFADDMTTYRLVDSVGTAKMSYSSNSRLIRIPSGGRVTTELILEAFAGGADAVLIADAEEKSSPYATSKIEMLRNVAAAREVLERAGIEIERLQGMEFVTVMLAKFVKIVNDLDSYVRRVGVIDRERRSRLLDGPSAAVVTAGTPSASTGRPIGGEHEE